MLNKTPHSFKNLAPQTTSFILRHTLQQENFLRQGLGQEIEKGADARGPAQVLVGQQPEIER